MKTVTTSAQTRVLDRILKMPTQNTFIILTTFNNLLASKLQFVFKEKNLGSIKVHTH